MAATDQPKPLVADAWLTLRPKIRGGKPVGFDIVKTTRNRPSTDQPVMRLRLAIPAAAFAQFAPTATVEVPADGFEFPAPIVTVEPVGEEPC